MQGHPHQAKRLCKLALLAALIALPLAGTAAVYKCTAANGSTVFSQVPCGDDAQAQNVQVQPPISSRPAPAKVGGQMSQNETASSCWLSKFSIWNAQNPQANAVEGREKMQQLQSECHWTPQSSGVVTPMVQPTKPVPVFNPAPKPVGAAYGSSFESYVADAKLLESRETAPPSTSIAYSDGANGALLKSVLDPARIAPLMNASIRQFNMQQFDALKRTLLPLLQRYSRAFASNPHAYEAEYLDSLQDNTTVVAQAMKQMQSEQHAAAPGGDWASLNQAMMAMLSTMSQSSAKDLRQQIDSGKFSPAGKQRATLLANAMAAQ